VNQSLIHYPLPILVFCENFCQNLIKTAYQRDGPKIIQFLRVINLRYKGYKSNLNTFSQFIIPMKLRNKTHNVYFQFESELFHKTKITSIQSRTLIDDVTVP
jgi:hypothetical protein